MIHRIPTSAWRWFNDKKNKQTKQNQNKQKKERLTLAYYDI